MMNPSSGDIKQFENLFEATANGYTVPLTTGEADELRGRNRAERRAFARGKFPRVDTPAYLRRGKVTA